MEFQRFVERAAHARDLVERLRIWIEAVENARRPDYTRVLSPYTPPESTDIVRGVGDDRAEVYSLGVLGHAIVTGTVAWSGRSTADLQHAIVSERLPPIDLPEVSRAASGRINRIIARATEKDPSARYRDREWLAAELRGLNLFDGSESTEPHLYHPPIHDEEYREIERWLHNCRHGRRECLRIVGPSGIGKTYLWETVEDGLRRADETWSYVKTGQLDSRPYQTIAQILDVHAETTAEVVSSEQVSARLRTLVSVIIPSIGDDTAIAESVDRLEGLDPGEELAELIRLVFERTGTTLVCIDDYQWTDRFSRGVIARVAENDPSVSIVILSRDSDSTVASHCPHTLIELRPLDRERARRFVAAIDTRENPLSDLRFERVYAVSRGNPMALASAIRDEVVTSSYVAARMRDEFPEDVAVAVAQDRIRVLVEPARTIAVLGSLIGSPVPVSTLYEASGFDEEVVSEAIRELDQAFIVVRQRSTDTFRFIHDSVESAARMLAGSDAEITRRAIRILVDRMKQGDDGAAYRAAQLLATERDAELSYGDWVAVFLSAANRAVRSLAPEEALRFARIGLRHVGGSERVGLLAMAHEAAYLKSDREMMSHYYREIVSTGNDEGITNARELWLRRCYADERFRGASMIGRRILAAVRPGMVKFRWEADVETAERFLRRSSPGRLFRRIETAGRSLDRWARIATGVLHRMFLPSLTNGAGEVAVLAYYILVIAERSGWSGHTGTGFIAWATYRAFSRVPGTWIRPHVQYATRLARMSQDPMASHSVRTLTQNLLGFWVSSRHRFVERLARLEREGRSLGNWQYVAHCIHLGVQSRLWRGEPLQTVRDRLDAGRREIRAFGFGRVDRALLKHQQMVETLMGYTSDPLRLDGAEIDEDGYLRSLTQSHDVLGLVGFWTAKAYLAVFADRAEIGVDHFARITEVLPFAGSFHDQAVIHFLWSLAAFRSGDRILGTQHLKIVRKLERLVPDSQRHRVRFLRGERALVLGRSRIAHLYLRSAHSCAVENRYVHEAGLIAERLAAVTADRAYLYLAWAHYQEWGSVPAAERIGERLGETAFSPTRLLVPSNDDEFVHATASAESIEMAIALTARRIEELTGASRVFIGTARSGSDELYLYNSDDRRVVRIERFPPDVALMLTELSDGESRTAELRTGRSRPIPVIATRSIDVDGTVLSVLVLGIRGASTYSSITRLNVMAVVRGANVAIALLRARQREVRNIRDLGETRQQLSETEGYRRRLFRALPEAFLLVTRNGGVVYSNHVADRYILRDRERAARFRDELRGDVTRLAEIAMRDGRVLTERLPFNERYLEVRTAPAHDAADVGALLAVSIRDVTEAVERDRRIAQQDRQLVVSDRLASIGMFSSAIVHEISNPNHILQLNTQSLAMVMSWLRSEVDTDSARTMVAQAKELVEQIEEASRRVESVLRMVKSYGREGRAERWELIDVNTVCERAFRFSRIMASQYTDRFRMNVAESLPPIRGERALLEQAIINLIKNACESLEDRHGTVELSVESDPEEPGVAISICDTGRGFPEEVQKNLGVPFVSGRAESGGTGLGLSIVFAIVEKHRGRLSVSRNETFTTRVTLHLPFASSDSQTPVETDQ